MRPEVVSYKRDDNGCQQRTDWASTNNEYIHTFSSQLLLAGLCHRGHFLSRLGGSRSPAMVSHRALITDVRLSNVDTKTRFMLCQ